MYVHTSHLNWLIVSCYCKSTHGSNQKEPSLHNPPFQFAVRNCRTSWCFCRPWKILATFSCRNHCARSEEEIAAKEAEVAGVTSTWVPPTETGLEHSAAIADSAAVALGAGGPPAGAEVKRVFKAVGSFGNEGATDSAGPAPGDTPLPTLKVSRKYVHTLATGAPVVVPGLKN